MNSVWLKIVVNDAVFMGVVQNICNLNHYGELGFQGNSATHSDQAPEVGWVYQLHGHKSSALLLTQGIKFDDTWMPQPGG